MSRSHLVRVRVFHYAFADFFLFVSFAFRQSKILLLFLRAAFDRLCPVYLTDRMSLLFEPLFQLQLKLESTSHAKFSSHRSVSGASSGFR